MEFSDKRRYIRFEPDAGDYVQMDLRPIIGEEFQLTHAALLVEESPMGGFGLACLRSVNLKKGQVFRCKVGKMAPLQAEVMWVREVDDKILRVGLKFLE